MKRIKTTNATMPTLSLQDDQVEKLVENKDHLLALNALFDAVKTGESGRSMARKIYHSDVIKMEKNKQHQTEKTAY